MNERRPSPPNFEIPDLELAAPVSKRATAPVSQRTASPLTPESAGFGLEISLPDLEML